ncbi:AbrB family transcriptional regulator [Synechococcus sp. PCC 7336]|uniref:AbrB family transcriptional regulator n=1 Tax=Synechococcus sp. PCC 7336 TaxID=195250 RepID=UPI000346A5D3|nr:AbrB family transcriptional regulator [Synechococcus sp. PCC 7336]
MAAKKKSQPLTGQALQDKVKEMQGADKKDIAKACGYISQTKGDRERINLMAFYSALLEAEGVEFEAAPDKGSRGREASYKASVHKNGNLLIGATYTKEMGLEPGDEFTLKLSKRSITLTRVD